MDIAHKVMDRSHSEGTIRIGIPIAIMRPCFQSMLRTSSLLDVAEPLLESLMLFLVFEGVGIDQIILFFCYKMIIYPALINFFIDNLFF